MNHRAIQKAVFRLQFDAGLVERFFAGDESCGLAPEEAALVRALEPRMLSADKDGKRVEQALGNITAEFQLSTAVAKAAVPSFDIEFFSSPHFHRAIAEDGRLPLAFGDYCRELAELNDNFLLSAFASLESEMAVCRRAEPIETASDDLPRLDPRHRLLSVPDGTLAYAERIKKVLDRAGKPSFKRSPVSKEKQETVLIQFVAGKNRFALSEVKVERLESVVAELLALARQGIDRETRRAFAESKGATESDIEGFVDELVADGILRRGITLA